MGWGRSWPERPPRPKVKKLTDEEKKGVLKNLEKEIEASPVLCALGVRVRSLRGRFYFERLWPDTNGDTEMETIGRATPLENRGITLLLEVEKRKNSWYEIKKGGPKKIVMAMANDEKGTFHGLGALDRSLRHADEHQPVRMDDDLNFYYCETGESCTAQEALFHYFGIPVGIVAEPRRWYEYHRTPEIVEINDDETKVLATFSSMSMFGSFSGTCLYAYVDDEWDAFTIKPNQSRDIETASAWLEKRNWKSWM